MLTCDAFGVLPPIAKLESAQAMYHFLSGYTAKVAGTEKGVSEPQATFSTCFGAPFMSRHPSVYGNLLRDLIARHDVNCWLVNTGWTGGKYGVGRRMPIKVTRGLLAAALDGSLAKAAYRRDTYFGLATPLAVAGIESSILNPVETWASREEFAAQAMKLVDMFRANFEKFASHVDAEVIEAQPAAAAA
jgi:phosphoenolpyruvate carboxykinase (ATP)